MEKELCMNFFFISNEKYIKILKKRCHLSIQEVYIREKVQSSA